MCLLLAFRDPARGGLWVAANRDERRARAWRPPALLTADPPVLGGLDVVGGGSWLAVNLAAGFVVGVTNARLGAPAGERSRGSLVLEAATQPSLPAAVALLTEVETSRYGPFNLLVVDEEAAFVATNDPLPRVEQLEGGTVVLGNERYGEPGPRGAAALRELEALRPPAGEGWTTALAALLRDHRGADPFCRHAGPFGTVSSTILHLRHRRVLTYLFAPGPPCRTAYAPVPVPWPPYS